ncbi:MAG: hypothetical protein P4L56_26290 [Candidatus Sulfopaludibacter sp.]|nr:hypothetical protein [Candidatus Sulfopaludibacter sp.]
MHKLAEVEEAKRLMAEAGNWSVWQWLTEKRRVRAAADAATAALEKAEKKVKSTWPDDLRKFYRQLGARVIEDGAGPLHRAVAAVKKADDAAYDARMDAEATFDEAERRLSPSMAREGTQKAIDAYCLHESAIRKAEAVARHQSEP